MCMCAKLLQSRPTLWDPMDCSLPDSSVHGNSPGKNTRVGSHALLQGIFLTQGPNPRLLCLLHWEVGSLPIVPPEKPLLCVSPLLLFVWTVIPVLPCPSVFLCKTCHVRQFSFFSNHSGQRDFLFLLCSSSLFPPPPPLTTPLPRPRHLF